MKQISFLFTLILIMACNQITSDKAKSFKRFSKRFKTIDLPMSTQILYRVHNNELVSTRIDTSFIQQFINVNYRLKADAPVYDGYAYAVKLPKSKEQDYQGLIYYQSQGQSQFFVLKTYSLDGELISTLPLSGDSSNYKRRTSEISEEQLIIIKDFLLHQNKKETIESFYEIQKDGLIIPLDTFYNKSSF